MNFAGGYVDETTLLDGIMARRLGGWLVDAIILAVLLGVLHLGLWIIGFVTFGLGWFLLGGLWVIPVAYLFAFVASPAQALVYAVGYAVTMAAGAIWLVAAFFTRRSRCLHDIVAGVAVLRADALGESVVSGAGNGWAVR